MRRGPQQAGVQPRRAALMCDDCKPFKIWYAPRNVPPSAAEGSRTVQYKLHTDLGQHGLQAGPGLGVEAPSDISGGAHQVLLALAPAHLLSFLDESMVGCTHPLQEEVMPIQELAVPLKQVHGDGQHAPQDVGKAVPQLHVTHTLLWPPGQHQVSWPYLCQRLPVYACHHAASLQET